MSFHPAPRSAQLVPTGARDPLFTPGPRLGWVFRDHRELAVPYPEPEPSQQAVAAWAADRAATAERERAQAWRWAGKPSIALAIILLVLAGFVKQAGGGPSLWVTAVVIIVACSPGLGYAAWCRVRRDQALALSAGQEYQQARAAWGQRAAQHRAAELARTAGQPEWGSAVSPASRTDIFGGTLAGWQAMLTVHGASILAERRLLAIDLTGQHATGMLTAAASAAQVGTVTYYLPRDLARCGLLTELSPAQLADAIAEAIHAGSPTARTDRAVDTWVIQQLAAALTQGGVTPRRLAAAAHTALGHLPTGGLLSAAEHELITGNLFPQRYRQDITPSLVRLDAVLAGLAAHGGDGWPAQPARCTCLTMDTAAPSASEEVLRSLIVSWLTVHVTTSAEHAPAVIIAGADTISRPHLERLADACERRGVPLTLMFRHLRDDAAAILGSGTATFMRLANHHEAEQAATQHILTAIAVNVERLYAHESPGRRERQPTALQKYIIGRELPVPHWWGKGDSP